jgi:hypothetical protein
MFATLASISESGNFVVVVMVGGAFTVAIVAIITEAIRKAAQTRAREESRREIAAYVAEGTISPDDAAKLLAAGGSLGDQIKEKIRAKMGA